MQRKESLGPPCPSCSRPRREVTVRSGDDELTMLTCGKCEQNSWYRDGQPVELPDVLRSVSKKEDFVLAPVKPTRRGQPSR